MGPLAGLPEVQGKEGSGAVGVRVSNAVRPVATVRLPRTMSCVMLRKHEAYSECTRPSTAVFARAFASQNALRLLRSRRPCFSSSREKVESAARAKYAATSAMVAKAVKVLPRSLVVSARA